MAGKASTLTVVLASTIPVICVAFFVFVAWRCTHRHSFSFFNRGITPIADEEIESWKADRSDEKELVCESFQPTAAIRLHSRHHQTNSSVSSVQKPPSLIVYQYGSPNPPCASGEPSPRSIANQHKHSFDMPQTPVLARAPNARPGLTDETVQGDDPFIPQLKRQPSRLSKGQSSAAAAAAAASSSTRQYHHHRHTSAFGANAGRDKWYGQVPEYQTQSRQSADNIPRRSPNNKGHDRIYSATANPPRMSLDEAGTSVPGGLAPRPIFHRSEIGRAIG